MTLPEAPREIDFDRLNEFLEANYPIKPEAVEETIKLAKAHETDVLTPQAYLLAQIGYIAKNKGIENLPVMLAAVAKMEKELPEDERRLTAKTYLGLLMTGENTSANKEADETGSVRDSYDHGERALALFNFWQEI